MRNDVRKNAAALFFASFMFVQFVFLRMGNSAGKGLLSHARQERVYVFLQVFVICGVALYALLHTLAKNGRLLKFITAAALALLGVFAGYMLWAPADSAVYLAVAFTGAFCLGYAAGRVYTEMARLRASGLRAGLCMGAGYSLALLAQYFFQLKWSIRPVLSLFLTASFAFLCFFLFFRKKEQETPEERSGGAAPFRIVTACAIASAFLLFIAFYNGYIHRLQIASGYTEYNVYSWPRLLMIPGMLGFGLIGDHKNGRFLPLTALCVSVVAFLNVVLAARANAYLLNMCLYYVSLSAAVSYYNLTFWKLAPETKAPAVWAAAGRVLDSLVVIPFCFVPFSESSAGVVLSLNVAALAAIIVLMAVSGDFDLAKRRGEEPPAPKAPLSEESALNAVSERYRLTPAETRVLRELVLTEEKQTAIAEKLSVKLRTVQAYITSIYKKTGVTTRAGLVNVYNETKK